VAFLPPQFFRPLEYVLELTEVALDKYRPLRSADLEAMLPPADWCLPLHMHKELQPPPQANEPLPQIAAVHSSSLISETLKMTTGDEAAEASSHFRTTSDAGE
jgi:hypothetical protein